MLNWPMVLMGRALVAIKYAANEAPFGIHSGLERRLLPAGCVHGVARGLAHTFYAQQYGIAPPAAGTVHEA